MSKFVRTGKIRVVYRHGQPIEVERAIFQTPPSRRLFVPLTHADAVAGFTAMGCQMSLVWCALLFRARVEQSDTVVVPIELLLSWGVHRNTRHRGIARLEKAGLIKTQRQRGRPTVCHLVRAPGR